VDELVVFLTELGDHDLVFEIDLENGKTERAVADGSPDGTAGGELGRGLREPSG
jgi:hypothetical protein